MAIPAVGIHSYTSHRHLCQILILMIKSNLTSLLLLAGCSLPACAECIDWSAIRHWSGEGPNRAALVVQFDTTDPATDNPGAIVWGFRWKDGDEPSGQDMFRAVASQSSDLLLFTQQTGVYGHTVCGIGYAPAVNDITRALFYDYESAAADPSISFGFDSPLSFMGQTEAPGSNAFNMAMEAIEAAADSHIIEHPLSQEEFGYPAYDYDWWQLSETAAPGGKLFWRAGWYKGYWSHWTGTGDLDESAYSSLGISSIRLTDGDINAWRYNGNPAADASSGASTWLPMNYDHFAISTGVENIYREAPETSAEYYSLDGRKLSAPPAKGIYIVRSGNKAVKRTAD